MKFIREHIVLLVLIGVLQANAQKYHRKRPLSSKRAINTYSYPVPSVAFNEKASNGLSETSSPSSEVSDKSEKTKVIVETVKAVSQAEFTETGPLDASIKGTNATSVSFSGYDADVPKPGLMVETSGVSTSYNEAALNQGYTYNKNENSTKESATTVVPPDNTYKMTEKTEHSTVESTTTKVSPDYTNNKNENSTVASASSVVPPATEGTTSVAPSTAQFPGYQYNSPSTGSTVSEGKIKSNGYKLKNNGYPSKIVKKPTKLGAKHPDSRPEESGFNGYQFNSAIGSQNAGSGAQPGMMGASYMRARSPYYNFHVMLD